MMEQQPLFSVLIASYNNAHYLKQTVDSVLAQTYHNWEIIIVDDCSTDHSKELYQELTKDSRIKVVYSTDNKGIAYTKHRCVEVASGQICGFLDADDKLAPEALSLMVEAYDSPAVTFAYSQVHICDKDLNILYLYESSADVTPNDPYFFNFKGEIFHFFTFKKEAYERTAGIDLFLQKAVDYDLYLRMYETGESRLVKQPVYYYRHYKGSSSYTGNFKSAHFWYWVVIMQAARRRQIKDMDAVVQLFYSQFGYTEDYYRLYYRTKGLLKYEKLNNLLSKIKTTFAGKKKEK